MQNASMSATLVSRNLGCITIEYLRRWFHVTGNVADHPWSGRPFVITAANDRCIFLQHLSNKSIWLQQQPEDSMVFIRRLPEIGWDKTFNLFVCTDNTLVRFSPDVIELPGRIGAAVTSTSDVLIGIWFCFPMNVGLTLAIPMDLREFIAVGESLLPMRASLSLPWTTSKVVQS